MVHADGPAWSFYRCFIPDVKFHLSNFICFPYAILCVMQGVNFFHFIGPGFARAGIHWNNPCGVSGSTLRLKPVGNAHRFTPKQTIGTSEAKQTRTKFGAAECQQGTHLVPTAEAIPFEVCRGSGLIFCIPQVKPRWFLLCLAMIRARGGTVSFFSCKHWFWLQQACVAAIHVACVVANCIWNQLVSTCALA